MVYFHSSTPLTVRAEWHSVFYDKFLAGSKGGDTATPLPLNLWHSRRTLPQNPIAPLQSSKMSNSYRSYQLQTPNIPPHTPSDFHNSSKSNWWLLLEVHKRAECWSRPRIWKEPRDSQSGIDGIEQPHLSLSRDGAIPHRYYWFLAGSSSVTGWLWSDQLGCIAEQRHSLLVEPLQVNFRPVQASLKGPLCLPHHHYVIQIFCAALNEHLAVFERPDWVGIDEFGPRRSMMFLQRIKCIAFFLVFKYNYILYYIFSISQLKCWYFFLWDWL